MSREAGGRSGVSRYGQQSEPASGSVWQKLWPREDAAEVRTCRLGGSWGGREDIVRSLSSHSLLPGPPIGYKTESRRARLLGDAVMAASLTGPRGEKAGVRWESPPADSSHYLECLPLLFYLVRCIFVNTFPNLPRQKGINEVFY